MKSMAYDNASEQDPWKYARPTDKARSETRHLMVCGPSPHIADVCQELYRLGAEHVSWSQGASHCFSTFQSPKAAAEASSSILRCRTSLATKFVDATLKSKHQKERSEDVPIPAALTAEACGIPGLSLTPEFVSVEEEKALLDVIDAQPWVYLSRRRVQHYGRDFNYIVGDDGPFSSLTNLSLLLLSLLLLLFSMRVYETKPKPFM